MCCAGLAWFFADERMTNTALPECMPLGCKAWCGWIVDWSCGGYLRPLIFDGSLLVWKMSRM